MTTPNNDLRSLIDAAAGANDSPKPASARSAASHPTPAAPQTDDIRSLVHQAANRSGGAAQQAHDGGDALAATLAKPSVFKSPRVIAITLALVLLLLGLGVWKTAQPALTGPAATLHDLAQSVEQYRLSHHGSLPEQLSNLEHFPKNAVEWQFKHWKARDAAGRTEVLWAPNGAKQYRIVLRQGNQVWVYNSVDAKSRSTQP